jgi:ABC-2 type transport system permease protein
MKLWNVITKSFREQIRSCWVLLLTLLMGPFFIFVYYLIVESSKTSYDILVLNKDAGVAIQGQQVNFGNAFFATIDSVKGEKAELPFTAKKAKKLELAIDAVKKKDADLLIVIPDSFSYILAARVYDSSRVAIPVEIYGDLTSPKYLITAVWANECLNDYIYKKAASEKLISVKETALGTSASIGEFDMIVPGILILSLIMLMFTASIAFVSEVENKTILRLKLSQLTALEFLGGIGIVQSVIGIFSMALTLATAILLGFNQEGSLIIMLIIGTITGISIIAFSLIIAAFTKSSNEVLIIGNFPMFLFMFFTGAAFPMKTKALFEIAGYPVSLQGLMTPVHAISALNKTLILNLGFREIIPEIIAITVLTLIYFFIGAVFYQYRHLKFK